MRRSLLTLAYLSLTILGIPAPPSVSAYDFETHRALSVAAFQLSSVAPRLQTRYGISVSDTLPVRDPQLRRLRLNPAEWIGKGARDEDEPFIRVLSHFYDPYHDRGLLVPPLISGEKAPDWALEEGGVQQEYSYRDARDAFHAGLTASDRDTRERSLGSMFYILGHVVHLIQDMAVPAHVRNDAHPIYTPLASLMEAYIEDFVREKRPVLAGDVAPGAILAKIRKARDLWATGSTAPLNRVGMAEFTNANFVSPLTNFTALRPGATAENYPAGPMLDLLKIDIVKGPETCKDGTPPPRDAQNPLLFYWNEFIDPVRGGTITNPRMTTRSIFDQRLQARGLPLFFALNCFNIDEAAKILLPRAVSYSAALLNYFFRGDLVAAMTDDTLFLTNATPGEWMEGTFTLHYETGDGTRAELARGTVALESHDTSIGYQVAVPPPGANPVRCLVVFRGRLGDAVEMERRALPEQVRHILMGLEIGRVPEAELRTRLSQRGVPE